jgi:hypothetical protein
MKNLSSTPVQVAVVWIESVLVKKNSVQNKTKWVAQKVLFTKKNQNLNTIAVKLGNA